MSMLKPIFLSIVVLSLFIQGSRGDDIPLETDKIIQEALNAWEEYGEFLSHCEGSVIVHTTWYDDNGGTNEEEKTVSEMICDYPLIVFSFLINQNKRRITGINKDYTFVITEEQKDVYSVLDITRLDEIPQRFTWRYRDWEEGGFHRDDTMDSYIADTFGDSLLAPSIPLSVLFTLPEFDITESERIVESGTNKVRISFTFSPESFSPIEAVRKGTIILLPDSFWLPESLELHITEEKEDKLGIAPYFQVRNYEYQNDYAMPLLKEDHCETTLNGRLFWNSSADYDLKYVKHRKYPPKRFTLSHYGLPEPDFAEKDYTPFRIFLFVFGLAFISLGLYQIYRKRSRSSDETE